MAISQYYVRLSWWKKMRLWTSYQLPEWSILAKCENSARMYCCKTEILNNYFTPIFRAKQENVYVAQRDFSCFNEQSICFMNTEEIWRVGKAVCRIVRTFWKYFLVIWSDFLRNYRIQGKYQRLKNEGDDIQKELTERIGNCVLSKPSQNIS